MAQTLTEQPTWKLAPWTNQFTSSAGQDMINLAGRRDLISFALGIPAVDLFPTEALSEAVASLLASDPAALQYSGPYAPLRGQIAQLMESRGLRCSEDEIFLTSGAQQGISLLATLLLGPGDCVLCEEYTYFGFHQAMRPMSAKVVTVATSPTSGIDLNDLEDAAKRHSPKLLYLMPDGHNPLGISLSQEKRRKLIELASRYNMILIEDDPYGFLQYDGSLTRPLRGMSDEWVVYVGSFSKLIAPGLRLGWLVVPRGIQKYLSSIKAGADLDVSTLSQRWASIFLTDSYAERHFAVLREAYSVRRNSMDQALRRHIPEASWTLPECGFYFWLTMGNEFDSRKLLPIAMKDHSVAFVPASDFRGRQADPWPSNALRLSFPTHSAAVIESGVVRLRAALDDWSRRPPD